MVASVVSGQRVSLRADSPFAGNGQNPPAGTPGTVTELDGEWATVDWDIGGAETNHKPTELDSIGAPPTNSGEWGWAQAYYDAKNQDVATILDRLNELSANYDEPFSVMYLSIIATGKVPNRINEAQLLPVITSGNRDSVSWLASNKNPAGSLTVSSVSGNSNTFSCWKMIDGTNGYWAPANWVGSWWEVSFSNATIKPTRAVFIFSPSDYRPKRIRIDIRKAGSDLLSSVGEFDIPPSTSTELVPVSIVFPPTPISSALRVSVVSVQNSAFSSYALINYELHGVVF